MGNEMWKKKRLRVGNKAGERERKCREKMLESESKEELLRARCRE